MMLVVFVAVCRCLPFLFVDYVGLSVALGVVILFDADGVVVLVVLMVQSYVDVVGVVGAVACLLLLLALLCLVVVVVVIYW